MITAVDTSVLGDVLWADQAFCAVSARALEEAQRQGALVICPTVLAELRAAFTDDDTLSSALLDFGVHVVAEDRTDGLAAGAIHRDYLANRPTAKEGPRRMVADFLIGAHARNHADRLLARDRGFFREYFDGLEVWYPES